MRVGSTCQSGDTKCGDYLDMRDARVEFGAYVDRQPPPNETLEEKITRPEFHWGLFQLAEELDFIGRAHDTAPMCLAPPESSLPGKAGLSVFDWKPMIELYGFVGGSPPKVAYKRLLREAKFPVLDDKLLQKRLKPIPSNYTGCMW